MKKILYYCGYNIMVDDIAPKYASYYVCKGRIAYFKFPFRDIDACKKAIDAEFNRGMAKLLDNPLIYCACGCGGTLLEYDLMGNKRKSIPGHTIAEKRERVFNYRPGFELMNKMKKEEETKLIPQSRATR